MSNQFSLTKGSKRWKEWRELATKPIPGKRSALYFLNAKVLGKEDLVPMTYRAHMAMCLFAENATGIPEVDRARVKLILVPRGVGKSSLITKGEPIRRICLNRNYASGIANEIADLAKGFLADIANEFESNELLQALFPEVIPDFNDTTWKADRIITKRDKKNPTSPSVLAGGVTGTVTGVHQDAWFSDDLLSKNAAEAARKGNMEEIEKTNRWITQLQPLLKMPKADPLYFIGTRWWEGDSYEFVEEFWGHGREAQTYIWNLHLPAQTLYWDYDRDGEPEKIERPPETQVHRIRVRDEVAVFEHPALDDAGRAIFPERYNEEELAKMQMEDPVFFAGQYMLNPTAGGASTFNAEWLKFYEWDGHTIRFKDQMGEIQHIPKRDLTVMISVDPAFSKRHTAARTAIPVVATDGTHLFLLEDFAERMDSEDDIAHKVLEFYLLYYPQKMFVETIVAQVAVANAIRRIFRGADLPEPVLEEIPTHGAQKKTMRIYGMEHYFKRGIFYVHKSHHKFIQEYNGFPRSILRDILDAMSFQKDEWEHIFNMNFQNQNQTGQERRAAEQSAINRVKKAWGRRRGRR